jgi:hypothetical protein
MDMGILYGVVGGLIALTVVLSILVRILTSKQKKFIKEHKQFKAEASEAQAQEEQIPNFHPSDGAHR